MSLLLSSQKKSKNIIDASIGEPYLIRDILFKYFKFKSPEIKDWSYPHPQGFEPLVKFLEKKHNAPVIITNGAKQALQAVFHIFRTYGYEEIQTKKPYWALLPSLAEDCFQKMNFSISQKPDIYLLVAPNNPDGSIAEYSVLDKYCRRMQDSETFVIMDGAYYSGCYLPKNYHLGPLGDVQIYSLSKMFGLPGLRLGYVVCNNKEFVDPLIQYMETSTVGVSSLSQQVAFDLFYSFNNIVGFEEECFDELQNRRFLLSTISNKFLNTKNIQNQYGLFAWMQKGENYKNLSNKLQVSDGSHYGNDNFVRINLGLSDIEFNQMIEILNS